MNKNIRKKIANLIKEDKKDWIEWYKEVLEDGFNDGIEKYEDDKQKIEYLESVEGNGSYDELFYSQGYIQGLKTALRLLNENK